MAAASLGRIADITETCKTRFESCTSHPPLAEDHWAEIRLADFNLWSSGAGASARSRASLDHRLALRPDAHEVIVGLLERLDLELGQCIDHASRRTTTAGPEAAIPTSDIAADSEAPDEVSLEPRIGTLFSDNPPISREVDNFPKASDDVSRCKANVDTTLNHLIRIAVSIRRSGTRSRLSKADATFDSQHHADLRTHLISILYTPQTWDETLQGLSSPLTSIQRRLIDANLRRRNRFEYAQEHSKRLQRPIQSDKSPPRHVNFQLTLRYELLLHYLWLIWGLVVKFAECMALQGVTPTNNDIAPIPDPTPRIATAKTDTSASRPSKLEMPVPSVTQEARTQMSTTIKKLEYPRPPPIANGAMTFKCPCCCQTLPKVFAEQSQWKKHIASDISPYTCIIPECPKPWVMYTQSKDWKDHLLSSHPTSDYWMCPMCERTEKGAVQFTVEIEFEEHFLTAHNDTVFDGLLPTLKKACKKSAPVEISCCPLCSFPAKEPYQVDRLVLLGHIAQHLHDFALRSLPWPGDISPSPPRRRGSDISPPQCQTLGVHPIEDLTEVTLPPGERDRPLYNVCRWMRDIANESLSVDDIESIADSDLDDYRDTPSQKHDHLMKHEWFKLQATLKDRYDTVPGADNIGLVETAEPIQARYFDINPYFLDGSLASDQVTDSTQDSRTANIESEIEETAAHASVRVLSLDGGGIRGLVQLIVLQDIFERMNNVRARQGLATQEPWQVFDIIGGISTGGLIAVMLGRLKFTIDECIEMYLQLSAKAFTSKFQLKHDTGKFEAAIKSIVGSDTALKDPDPNPACKVFVVSHAENTSDTAVFRTYLNVKGGDNHLLNNTQLWQACRATSAALTFFEPITIGEDRYSDGGLLENNPINQAYSEARQMFPDRPIEVLSLGTGIEASKEFNPGSLSAAGQLARLATESRKTASDFERAHAGTTVKYFRFDPPCVGDIGLEKAERLDDVRRWTLNHIEEQTDELLECAMTLANPVGETDDSVVSVIDSLERIKKAHDKFKDAKNFPEAFKEIAGQIDLAKGMFQDVDKAMKDPTESGKVKSDKDKAAVQRTVKQCTDDSQDLANIFIEIEKHRQGNWLEKYWDIFRSMAEDRKGTAEEIWARILEGCELLATTFELERLSDNQRDNKAAIEKIKQLPSSLSDDATGYTSNDEGEIVGVMESNHAPMTFGTSYSGDRHTYHYKEKSYEDCLRALFLTDPTEHLRKAREFSRDGRWRYRDGRAPGTCQWIESDDSYQEWYKAPAPALLWIRGEPGIGKTILSTHLLENVLPQQLPAKRLAYFLCNNSDPKRNNAVAILRGLLWLLLDRNHDSYKHFGKDYSSKSTQCFEKPGTLWPIFREIVNSFASNDAHLCILIDAFDECERESRKWLCSQFKELLNSKSVHLKVILTSRPNDDTDNLYTNCKCAKYRLVMGTSKVGPDLERLIEHEIGHYAGTERPDRWNHGRLSESCGWTQSTAIEVHKQLVSKHGNTFLWISLMLDSLARVPPLRVLTELAHLPKELLGVYQRILYDIEESENQDFAVRIFHLVLSATAPMSLRVLAQALYFDLEKREHVPEQDEIKEHSDMIKTCGSLLRTDGDPETNQVIFIHPSVKDFMIGNKVSDFWLYDSDNGAAAEEMFERICTNYLNTTDFNEVFKNALKRDAVTAAPKDASISWPLLKPTSPLHPSRKVLAGTIDLLDYLLHCFPETLARSIVRHPIMGPGSAEALELRGQQLRSWLQSWKDTMVGV